MMRNPSVLVLSFILVLAVNTSASATDKKHSDRKRPQAPAESTKVAQPDPAKIEMYRNRARHYFDRGDFDKGIADLSTIIRLCPNDPQAYRVRAEAYHAHGDPLNAILCDKPWRDTRQQDYRRAIADYTESLRLQPADSATLQKRGQLYLGVHDYERAIADCTEALRLNPGNADAYKTRSIVYRNKKDYDRAIADCTAFIRLNPSDWARLSGYGERAELYEAKGDNEHAQADHAAIIRFQPDSSTTYVCRGDFFLRTGAFDKALADYSQAIRIEKPRAHTDYVRAGYHSRRGWVYLRKGDLDAAEAEYSQAIKLHDGEGDYYAWRALVHLYRGERALALVDGEQAAQRYQWRSRRRLLRSGLLLLLGKGRQALADYWPRTEQQGMGSMGMGGMNLMPSMPPVPQVPIPPAHLQRQ